MTIARLNDIFHNFILLTQISLELCSERNITKWLNVDMFIATTCFWKWKLV